MQTERLLNCQASITTFDHCQDEVMISYATPILINQNGTLFAYTLSYSNTTWQHIHKYLKRIGYTKDDVCFIDKNDFINRLRNLGIIYLGRLY